jgi:hypothetical protein
METIKITVNSKEHARLLMELAKELNFVASVESVPTAASSEVLVGKFASEEEFLSMCGLWKDRDISVEKIREQAWRKIER